VLGVWRSQAANRVRLPIALAPGHDDLRTTQRYINEAQTFEGPSFGVPFPEVPLGCLTIFGSNYGSNSGIPAVDNAIRSQIPEPQGRPQGVRIWATAIRDNRARTWS
jgi:hypothetical protein